MKREKPYWVQVADSLVALFVAVIQLITNE